MKLTKSKVENQLRQERVENKAHQQQINKFQRDLLIVDSKAKKGEATHKLFNEKENTI